MKTYLLKLRPAGMFSNVNEVIQQLYLAQSRGYQFVIDWSRSCYRDERRSEDPWLYYFEPCFAVEPDPSQKLSGLIGGVPVACTRENIITPRKIDGECNPLLLPKNRSLPGKVIAEYLDVNDQVKSVVSDFAGENFQSKTLALHIRGPGRTHGGVPKLRADHKLTNGVPLDLYFHFVERYLEQAPESKIFLCSDSEFVIRDVIRKFGERVITYPSARSEFGEMHANHPENRDKVFSPYKLGFDIVAEAHLLSQCDYFIHGNSNVVNYVLCKNPDLANTYVYDASASAGMALRSLRYINK